MPKGTPSFVARLIYVFSVASLATVILHGVYSNFLLRDVVKNAPQNVRFITEPSQSYKWDREHEFTISKGDVAEIKAIIYQQFYFGPLYILTTLGLSGCIYFLVKGSIQEEDADIIYNNSYQFLVGAFIAWIVLFVFHANTDLLHYVTISPISDLFLVPKG